jgi:3-deoxy-7-phosphoheptulonate synthase
MEVENKSPGKDLTPDDLKTKIPLVSKKHPEHRSIINISGIEFGKNLIPVFAGPNTVENEDMIVATAKAIKKSGAHFLRAGAFKPLSFPYRGPKFFELREEGLKFLKTAKQETGIPIITEIMHIDKIDLVAEVADIMQIGARNMQNYPLLEAVAESGKPIMLKRHFGCSLRDWLGAAEYILHAGNPNVILCERGVVAPHTHRTTSRFLLDLQVVPAAQEITHLPIVTDPSHATFWRKWVEPMSLASIGAGADGIMLEVHPDPENAAVDPLQPINFDAFNSLMKKMEKVAQAVGRTLGVSLNKTD